MHIKSVFISALAVALLSSGGIALAADQDRDRVQSQDQIQKQDKVQNRDRIYGSQLMTNEERDQYRDKMRAAKTSKERQQVRAEHHERMMERAKAQGMKLPDAPPAQSRGMGSGGMSPGGSMGPGGGMGSGRQGR